MKNGDSSPNKNSAVLFLACGVEIKLLVFIFGRKNGIAQKFAEHIQKLKLHS